MEERAVAHRQAQRIAYAMHSGGLLLEEVWLHFFSLGGDMDEMEVEAYLHHALELPRLQRDILAHAVNELLMHRPVLLAPYSEEIEDEAGDG